jgi:hypothetical protein
MVYEHLEYRRNKITFARAVLNLIGHLVGSSILFVSFILLGWCVSFFLHWLDGIHKLPPDVFVFITKCELYLVYGDAVLCGILFVAGAWKFFKELGNL